MRTKQDLIREVARSRSAILRDVQTVRSELDYTAKMRNAVRSRPFAWLSGATALGYIFAGPKTRTVTKVVGGNSPSKKRADSTEKKAPLGLIAIVISVVRFAFPMLRPLLLAYATRRFGDFAERLAK